jgi:nucleotide-binding universal stress UspA family protein
MKVLIPLDGSKFAEVALESVSSLVDLTANGVEVHLVKVLAPEEGTPLHTVFEMGHKEAKEYLKRVALDRFPAVAHTKVIVGAEPAAAIEAYARLEHIDLIVMTTHGETGMASVLTGGVTAKLLRSRVAPILMARPDGLNERSNRVGISAEIDFAERLLSLPKAA